MNDQPLTFGHGAPARLRNEIAGGHGGYNQDHEFFGYRQPIQ